MADQRYNSFSDEKALQAEVDKILKMFGQVKSGIKELQGLGIQIDAGKNVRQVSDTLNKQKKVTDELTVVTKEYNKTLASIVQMEAKMAVAGSDAAKTLADRKVKQKELNKELENEAKILNSLTGSIDNLKARVAKLTTQRDKIQPVDADSIRQIDQFNKRIDNLNALIEKNQDKLGKRKINVGNYEGSARIIVDAFERSRQKLVAVERDFGKMSPEAAAARREFESLQRVTDNPQFLNVAARVGDTTAELRFFTKQLIDLEKQGQKDTEVYKQLQQQLAKLTDQVQDTRQEIKALSSDTRGFDLFASSVSSVASIFQTAAGAADLLGVNSQETQEAIRRLVAIQSVANGVREIANQITQRGTALNKAFAFVQQQVAIMTNTATTATNRFSAALKLTGIGLLITALGFLATKLFSVSDSADEAEKALGRFNNRLEQSTDRVNRAIRNIQNETALLVEQAKQRGATEEEISKIIVAGLQKEADERKKLVQTQTQAVKDSIKAIAGADLAKSLGIGPFLQETGVVTSLEEAIFLLQKVKDFKVSDKFEELDAATQGNVNLLLESLKSLRDAFEGVDATATDVRLTQEREKTRIAEEGFEDREELDKKQQEINDRNRQAEFEKDKIFLERRARLNEAVFNEETGKQQERLVALSDYVSIRITMINREAEYEKGKRGLTAKEIEKIEADRQDKLTQLAEEGSKARAEIVGAESKKEIEVKKSFQDDLKKAVDAGMQAADAARNKDFDKEKEHTEKKKELYKQLYSEITALAFDFFKATIDNQKNAIQEDIDALDKRKNAEIEAINNSTLSVEEKNDRIQLIEKTTQAKRESLEARQRQLDIQRAKFEKAETITGIISRTAEAIIATLAKTPPPAGTPLAILVGAIGAAQLARAIATPIPKFASGTDDAPAGPAIVGEIGSEIVVTRSGKTFLTPPTPTLTMLSGGEKIIPADVTRKMMATHSAELSAMFSLSNSLNQRNGGVDNDLLKEQNAILKRLEDKPTHHITIIENQSWHDYVHRNIKS